MVSHTRLHTTLRIIREDHQTEPGVITPSMRACDGIRPPYRARRNVEKCGI
jgi:hypothetical protein